MRFSNDRLYRLSLVQNFALCDKLTPLIPFRSCPFTEIGDVEFKGQVLQQLRENAADMALLEQGPDAWSESAAADRQVVAYVRDIEFLSLTYFFHMSASPNALIPDHLAKLHSFAAKNSRDVLLADVVVSRAVINSRRPEIELLRDAIFIRGKAIEPIAELEL